MRIALEAARFARPWRASSRDRLDVRELDELHDRAAQGALFLLRLGLGKRPPKVTGAADEGRDSLPLFR